MRVQDHGEQSSVASVIVNWNGWRDTVECVESLLAQTYEKHYVIVVDNASTDGSVEKMIEWARAKEIPIGFGHGPLLEADQHRRSMIRLWLLRANQNAGFSGGNNLGIKWALTRLRPRYVGIFNNDTVLDTKVLEAAIRDLESDSSIGMVGGKIYYYHEPNRIWFGGGHISWIRARGVYERRDALDGRDKTQEGPRYVSFLSGAFWVIRSSVFATCGLLPEEYFVGGEESEFCVRVRRAGWRLLYDPALLMWHKVGRSHDASSGLPASQERVARGNLSYAYGKPRHLYNWYRYHLLFARRNAPRSWYWVVYSLFMLYSVGIPVLRPRAVSHIPKRLHKLALRQALYDHRRFDSIRLEHLSAFDGIADQISR